MATMSLDEQVLADVQAARDRLEALEDEAYEARAALHQAVRRLHAAGGSMREIATVLAMSHQRVHQIIGTDGIVEVEGSPAAELSTHPSAAASGATVTTPRDACSFCGAPRRELDKLLAGPGPVFICGRCVRTAAGVVAGRPDGTQRLVAVAEDATCSFCGAPSSAGGMMAGAPDGAARICGGCAGTCDRLVHQEGPDRAAARRAPRLRCSFCNRSAGDAQRLIAGPGIYICDGCVDAAGTVVRAARPARGPRQVVLRPVTPPDEHECPFCGKAPAQVLAMVRAGRARICDECLALCDEINREAGSPPPRG